MEPGFTRIIHPGLGPGSVSEVPETSLPQWYMSGWRLLLEGETPLVPPLSAPEPVTAAEVTVKAAPETKAEAAPKKETK